jgi:hypothetical protein
MLCLFYNENGGVLLVAIISLNLFYGMYIMKAQAFVNKNQNHQDLINECVFSFSTYWKMLYSNLVSKQDDQYFYAKIELTLNLFNCFFNFIIIVMAIIHNNKKRVIYLFEFI